MNSVRTCLSVLTMIVVLAGCDSSEKAPAPNNSALPSSVWTLSPAGAGPVKVGMSYRELTRYMKSPSDTAAIQDACGFIAINAAPDGLKFMVEGRRLVRLQTQTPSIRTPDGASVGDTEDRILALYPNARRVPHKYTDGSYLIVLANSAGDSLHRYVFETDGDRVIAMRAGVYPPVEYVEGCS